MIIFTVTNNMTGQVYVGTTGNDLDVQWKKITAAAELDLDYPLYREIRRYGPDQFNVEEWDVVEDRRELATLEREAIETFGAASLRGYKTALNKPKVSKPTRRRKATNSVTASLEKELEALLNDSDDEPRVSAPTTPADQSASEPKKSAGRVIKASNQTEAPTPEKNPATTRLGVVHSAQPSTPNNKLSQVEPEPQAQTKTRYLEPVKTTPEAVVTKPRRRPDARLETLDPDALVADILSSVGLADINELSSEPEPAPEPAAVVEPAPEPIRDERYERICTAISRQRELRDQRTQQVIEQERKQLMDILADMGNRAGTSKLKAA